jgi:multidrug resistance protein
MPRRRALAVLFFTVFLTILGFGIIIPNLAYYARDFEASPFQIGALMATYSVMQFFLCPWWGALSDRVGRRPILVTGLVGAGLSFLLFGVAWSLPVLFAARILSGALASAALPTAMAYVADVTDEKGRGKGMGLMGAAIGLGFTIGPAIGGELSRFGHNVPFLAAGALTLATAAMAVLILEEPPEHRREDRAKIRIKEAMLGPLGSFFLLAFFVSFAMASLETTFPQFIADTLGLGAPAMGRMFTILGVILIVLQGGALGRLINLVGEETILLGGLALNIAGCVLLARAAGTGSVTATLVAAGVGNQIIRPTNSSLITKRTPYGHGASMGLMDSMDSLGRVLGPLVAGAIYSFGPGLPFEAGAVALVLMTAVFLPSYLRRRAEARQAVS